VEVRRPTPAAKEAVARAAPEREAAVPLQRLAYVGLGANLGDARATVERALRRLGVLGLVRHSALYGSAPVQASGPDFVNAVAELRSGAAPLVLLDALQAIELEFGRERPWHHAPRTLDLDLLIIEGMSWCDDRLTLPHPRLHQRAFVLRPLLELVPAIALPGLGRLADHLDATTGQRVHLLPEVGATGG
jgi:2-amino-4-hydroxy-6-hydroxymethyldihydropteridine diphosphokinase